MQRSLALVPEDEAVPAALTARQLVRYVADLHGVTDRTVVDRSLDAVDLLDVAGRRVGGFSKGMRQRTKIAAALVTDPTVLVLDEPLNGADPVQRVHLITLFRRLGAEGRTVIVSSHILHEVERLAERQIVLLRGRLAAAGDHRAIRDAMADRPRRVLVRSPEARGLAAALLELRRGQWRHHRRRQRGRRLDPSAGSGCRAAPTRPPDRGPPRRGQAARRLPREHVPGAGPMTATATGTAVLGYTLRACIPVRRWWTLALPCAAAVLFGLLSRLGDQPADQAFASTAAAGLFSLLIPIACLVIGDAVLGAEMRSGTFHFTWLSPAPVRTIVIGRWLGGWLVALVTLVPAMALAAIVAESPASVPAMAIATAAGSAAYVALFVFVGCAVRRAAIWSLVIVFLVERLLGSPLSGIAQLSPMWEGRAVFAGLAPGADDLLRDGVPDGWAAVVRLAIITVVMLALASWRLRHLRLTGASD